MQEIVDQQIHVTSTPSRNSPSHTDTNNPQVQEKSMIQESQERFCQALTYLFIFAVVFLSAGMPYWYYRCHRPRTAISVQPDPECAQSETDSLCNGIWQNKLPQLLRAWKTHRTFIGFLLAFMFPMVSVSPLPKCSWAYIFAMIGVADGPVAYGMCYLYEEHFNRPDESPNKPLFDAWFKSPQHGLSHEHTLRFWVFISLPTVWFFWFLTTICMSILMVVIGEQTQVDEGPGLACPSGRRGILRGFVSVMFLVAIVSLIYMKSIVNYFSTDEPSSE
ncbi:hypothetical protein P691DRAFT_735160 [Macrolepiota fuliginosa MF-IS2]|uniref:Uncharacterized protein n=1 Tax=Macrolepiota fuliginosa MF-IS2 TaxID=1400762 RepID=A0A9P5X6C9_9AGAR|nr:hypothetical protein P691DRAFT_735160 [Macrolepiota fuliginosa MF-IS2]